MGNAVLATARQGLFWDGAGLGWACVADHGDMARQQCDSLFCWNLYHHSKALQDKAAKGKWLAKLTATQSVTRHMSCLIASHWRRLDVYLID